MEINLSQRGVLVNQIETNIYHKFMPGMPWPIVLRSASNLIEFNICRFWAAVSEFKGTPVLSAGAF